MDIKEFSIKNVSEDSGLARELLEVLSIKTYNFIDPKWQERTEDEIIDRACYALNLLYREMDAAEHMKKLDALQ